MLAAVWNTLLTWWGLQDNLPQIALGMDIYCYGGVLAAPVGEDTNKTCPSLDGEIWNRTLALVLDAMIQTYPRVGNASQTLFAHAQSIGMWQWSLQGIIPFSAFVLYVACLAYTVTVYWAGETMEELDLLEVVDATRAEEERLTKSAIVGGKLKEQEVARPSWSPVFSQGYICPLLFKSTVFYFLSAIHSMAIFSSGRP